MNNLYQKIARVQNKIGKINKNQENPNFNSTYFDINQVLKQLQPLLEEEGLIVMQPLTNIDGKPGLRTIIAHNDGTKEEEVLAQTTPLPLYADQQRMGSAITYFRRYALQSLFCLQAEDDDANAASRSNGEKIKTVEDLDLRS